MARCPRMVVPDLALHIVQRGNNRQQTFFEPSDYRRYLQDLGIAAQEHRCAVHAYVLMSNHVHLLVTPAAPDSASGLMQAVGRRYVRYLNDRRQRTGGLWDGRFRSSVVASDRYLLACSRYIESNPVRVGMITTAAAYPWSSHAANVLGLADGIVTPSPAWLGLGHGDPSRRRAYAALFETPLDQRLLAVLRRRTARGEPLADPATIEILARLVPSPLTRGRHGGDRRSLRRPPPDQAVKASDQGV